MNILFICSRNQWRSRTAEDLFKNNGHHGVRSAGTSPSARIIVTKPLLGWADCLIFMERKHKRNVLEKFRDELKDKRFYVLDIPDHYGYMDTELIDILTSHWKNIIGWNENDLSV